MIFLIIYFLSVLIVGTILLVGEINNYKRGFDITVRDIVIFLFGTFTPIINTFGILLILLMELDRKIKVCCHHR